MRAAHERAAAGLLCPCSLVQRGVNTLYRRPSAEAGAICCQKQGACTQQQPQSTTSGRDNIRGGCSTVKLTLDLGDLDGDVLQAVGAILVGGAQVALRRKAGACDCNGGAVAGVNSLCASLLQS